MPFPAPRSGIARARLRRVGPARAVVAPVVAVSVALVFGATLVAGQVPTDPPGFDPALLTPVQPEGSAGPPAAAVPPDGSAAPVLEEIEDFRPPERTFGARPQPNLNSSVGVIVKPTPRPRVATSGSGGGGSGRGVSGSASWYCRTGVSPCHYQHAGGMYAAAGPALRVGDWRGRSVRVCANGRCVRVRLIDWCQCYGTRVIDLYSDAFRQLAPLSRGTTRVTVSW